MLESVWMDVPVGMDLHVDLNTTAWLLIGSLQLAALCGVALALNRWIKSSAVGSHRLWLTVLLLTMGCLPIHWLSLGWMPVAWSNSEPRVESTAPVAAAGNSSARVANANHDDSSAALADSAQAYATDEPVNSSVDSHPSELARANVDQPVSVVAIDVRSAIEWLSGVVALIYAFVGACLAVRIVLGLRKLDGLWRTGRAIDDSSTVIFANVAQRLKLGRPVPVRAVEHLSMPLVFGVFRHRVLVPDDFEQWPLAEQESVAFHELTHVRRRDMSIEVVSQLLCAVYWFHPASWLIKRKLRESREWATDETVLRHGLSASSYAHSIVAILSRLSEQPQNLSTTPAVAMSLYGDMELRLNNILASPATDRFRRRSLCLIILLCFIAGATCFRLAAAEPTSFPQEAKPTVAEKIGKQNITEQKIVAPETVAQKISKVPPPNALWATIEENENDLLSRIRDCEVLTVTGDAYHSVLTVEGQVRSADGQPVEGAIVLLRESSTWRISAQPTMYIAVPDRHLVRTHDVFSRAITDRDGKYRFDKVKSPPLEFGNPWRGSIVAGHPKLGVGWLNLPSKEERVRVESGMTIVLAPIAAIEGRYVTPSNQPLSGAVMNLYNFYTAGTDVFSFSNREFDLQASQLTPRDTTAADGSFVLRNLPKNLIASVGGPVRQDWLSGHALVATSADVKPGPPLLSELRIYQTDVVSSPCLIKADPGIRISLIVFDPEKKPVPGAKVLMASSHDGNKTDIDGRAQLHLHSSILRPKNSLDYRLRLYVDTPEDSEYLRKYVEVSEEQVKAEQPIEILLQKCVRVSGIVHDQTTQPVEKIFVRQAGERRSALSAATTTADGRYTIKLPPGKHTLLFTTDTPGFDLPSTSEFYRGNGKPFTDYPHITVDVSDGQAKDVGTFTVNRVGGIEAKVWLPDGDAAVGADVVIMDSDNNQVPLSMPFPIPSRRLELSKHVVTDELGQAQLLPKGKPSRRATIVAKLMDGDNCLTGEVTIPETHDGRIQVRLKPAMKIEGQVLKDGKPLAGAIVRIEEHTSIGGGGIVGYSARTAVSDGEGWYRTTGEVGREYRAVLESVPGLQQTSNESTSVESSTQDVLRFRPILLKTLR